MTNLTITASDVALVKVDDLTKDVRPAGEALSAGEAVRVDTSTGHWTPGNAAAVAESRVRGIAVKSAYYANEPISVAGDGAVLDLGDALDALAYDARVWLSDTDGLLADTPGTFPVQVGRVVPAFGATTPDKLLKVEIKTLTELYGFIDLPLAIWREVGTNDIQNLAAHGGEMAKDSTPIFEFTNGDADSALRLRWVASDSNAIALQATLPPDFDDTADLVIHLRAAMAGTTNTPVIDCDAFFNEGDTKVEDASAAITGTTVAEYTITIAAADIPAGAQTVSLELTPGAHTTDALYVYAIWLEYTKA